MATFYLDWDVHQRNPDAKRNPPSTITVSHANAPARARTLAREHMRLGKISLYTDPGRTFFFGCAIADAYTSARFEMAEVQSNAA